MHGRICSISSSGMCKNLRGFSSREQSDNKSKAVIRVWRLLSHERGHNKTDIAMKRMLILPRRNEDYYRFIGAALYNGCVCWLVHRRHARAIEFPRKALKTTKCSQAVMAHTHPDDVVQRLCSCREQRKYLNVYFQRHWPNRRTEIKQTYALDSKPVSQVLGIRKSC